MLKYLRRSAFKNITNVRFESDKKFRLKVGLNLLFFYNVLDKGEFVSYESKWVTVHKQRVIEYGQIYDDDKLDQCTKSF